MDNDLKQYLDENFSRINGRFAEMEARMDKRFGEVEGRFAGIDERFANIDGRFETLETRLNERIEKTETNLLTAFHGWARPMEIRVHGVATMVLGFEERMALAEQRISELERRKAS